MFLIPLFLFASLTNCYGSVDIDKYLKICDRNSADVNDCLLDAIQEGLVSLADGIQDLDIPAVDPYHQKELRVEYKNNQEAMFKEKIVSLPIAIQLFVNALPQWEISLSEKDILTVVDLPNQRFYNVSILVKMNMWDIYVEGLKTSTVRDARLRADEERFNLEVDMFSPHVFVRGSYLGEGKYNSLRVNATGQFNTSMTDLVYTWKLIGVPEKINGETYVKINSFYMRPDVGSMVTFLSNDNPETREITNLGNRFANANWKTLYRELLPFAQSNWNRIGIRVANKLFLKVPYNQLFPSKS